MDEREVAIVKSHALDVRMRPSAKSDGAFKIRVRERRLQRTRAGSGAKDHDQDEQVERRHRNRRSRPWARLVSRRGGESNPHDEGRHHAEEHARPSQPQLWKIVEWQTSGVRT